MAELCINLENKVGAKQEDDPNRYKVGDVVCVTEDGHKWNDNETRGQFLIVKVPGVPAEKLYDMMEPVFDKDGEPIARRSSVFDLVQYDAIVVDRVKNVPPEQLEEAMKVASLLDEQVAKSLKKEK